MATVFDVAAYILECLENVTAMKLQKLVYYSQAWSLVWDDAPIFSESIKAWANGPVCPELYELHRGQFLVSCLAKGESNNLNSDAKETINKILNFYGDKDSQWLSDLTHHEDPWIDARKGLLPGERGSEEITHASMAEYYGSLF
jgi:uncharacterized phage-associated protein